jgi:hypothetical protein
MRPDYVDLARPLHFAWRVCIVEIVMLLTVGWLVL